MLQIKIAVNVPLQAAVSSGTAEYGHAEVALDGTAIQALSPAAREVLANAVPNGGVLFVLRAGVQERLAVAAPTVEATITALENFSAYESKVQERRAIVQNAAERAREGALAYAEGVPELSGAVEEGYEVSGAVADHVAAAVASAIRAAFGRQTIVLATLVEGRRDFASAKWEERAPRESQLVLLEKITEAVKNVVVPDGWTLEVSRVMRFRESRRADARTTILVTVSCPAVGRRVVVVDAE